jgi:hypothetical protein
MIDLHCTDDDASRCSLKDDRSGQNPTSLRRFDLKRDEISLNRHRALAFLIEHDLFGKPLHTFRDHALEWHHHFRHGFVEQAGFWMSHVTYKVIEHDGGWAYTVNGVFSESFPNHAAALAAARRAAAEQRTPGRTEVIEYETPDGKWRTETADGSDRPETDVEDAR